jgi:hypothetical protein
MFLLLRSVGWSARSREIDVVVPRWEQGEDSDRDRRGDEGTRGRGDEGTRGRGGEQERRCG